MPRTTLIPSTLPNGAKIYIEASESHTAPLQAQGRQGMGDIPFAEIASTVQEAGETLLNALKTIGPTKTTVTLGFKITAETGSVIGLILKGGGEADFTVALEWSAPAPTVTAGGSGSSSVTTPGTITESSLNSQT